MGKFYTWTKEELGLNVPEMDREHQVLIDKMNALYDTVDEKQPPASIKAKLEDLATFTVKHFSDEEAYMEKIGFEGLVTHKVIHQQLLSQFNGYVEEFKKSQTISPAFFNFLKVWLTGHIRGIDKKYSEFKPKKS